MLPFSSALVVEDAVTAARYATKRRIRSSNRNQMQVGLSRPSGDDTVSHTVARSLMTARARVTLLVRAGAEEMVPGPSVEGGFGPAHVKGTSRDGYDR